MWPRYVHDTAGYIPDTGEKRKGKNVENKEIWVEISTATGRRRLLQVTAGPGSHPLVVSLLLLLRLSPHLFLSSPSSSFSLFSTFSCFCFMCLGSNRIMCIPNEYSYNKKVQLSTIPKEYIYLFLFFFPKKTAPSSSWHSMDIENWI